MEIPALLNTQHHRDHELLMPLTTPTVKAKHLAQVAKIQPTCIKNIISGCTVLNNAKPKKSGVPATDDGKSPLLYGMGSMKGRQATEASAK